MNKRLVQGNCFWREVPIGHFSDNDFVSARMEIWRFEENVFTMSIPGLAVCEVKREEPILVGRWEGNPDLDLRMIVQGLPLAAYWAIRKCIAMHASAVATPEGAILFLGESGAGKTTLTAAFSKAGYPVISDEVSAMRILPEGGPYTVELSTGRFGANSKTRVQICTGMPDLLLWDDSLTPLKIQQNEVSSARPGLARFYYSNVPSSNWPVDLIGMYVLRKGDLGKVEIKNLDGERRALAIRQACFNLSYSRNRMERMRQIANVLKCLRSVRVAVIERPKGQWVLEEVIDRLREDWESGHLR